jgi:hypothetical protein
MHWAQGAFGGHWAALIQRVLDWPRSDLDNDLSETLALIQFTARRCEQYPSA